MVTDDRKRDQGPTPADKYVKLVESLSAGAAEPRVDDIITAGDQGYGGSDASSEESGMRKFVHFRVITILFGAHF